MRPKCSCTRKTLCNRCAIILLVKVMYSVRENVKGINFTVPNQIVVK